MKISIIMPVYNEEAYIEESIESVIRQTYCNWELLIVNDGSTDSTPRMINSIMDSRVQVFNKENSDQLNSIDYVKKHVTGDVVCLLHGDDLFAENSTLSKIANEFPDKDKEKFLIYPYTTIDDMGKELQVIEPVTILNIGFWHANAVLNFGRNMLTDHFVCTACCFFRIIESNYIKRNVPFWNSGKSLFLCQAKTVKFPYFKYRVHQNNYINNNSGLLSVVSGNMRSTLDLLEHITVPFFGLQRILFKLYSKFGVFGLPVFYRAGPASDSHKIVVLTHLLKMYCINWGSSRWLKLVYENLIYSGDSVVDFTECQIFDSDFIGPKDVRLLNNCLESNDLSRLPKPFVKLMEGLEGGASEIKCLKRQKEVLRGYLDLLNVRVPLSVI